MARGFESKSVADQQEAAQAVGSASERDLGDPARVLKRRRLELSRADVLRQMSAARAEGHREMLKRALAALDKELASLS
ncbi:MAG TPA: hypothetical protein VN461_00845 [Vicinamibacteria bacterium]|jgi:hypothetical protein|nr:hypothetical protein [Vicinamibacteria bacterium]